MKNPFKPGDKKQMKFRVKESDMPNFPTGTVHEVYSTYALARDAEWTTRQFVLEMKEFDEEGIGTKISVVHHAAAFLGEEVLITGKIKELHNHEIICSFTATCGQRLIATGETGQKILKKEKFLKIFSSINTKK